MIWNEVSPKYLKTSASPTNWKEFFLGLGVQSGLAVERINREINPTEEVTTVTKKVGIKWLLSVIDQLPYMGCTKLEEITRW